MNRCLRASESQGQSELVSRRDRAREGRDDAHGLPDDADVLANVVLGERDVLRRELVQLLADLGPRRQVLLHLGDGEPRRFALARLERLRRPAHALAPYGRRALGLSLGRRRRAALGVLELVVGGGRGRRARVVVLVVAELDGADARRDLTRSRRLAVRGRAVGGAGARRGGLEGRRAAPAAKAGRSPGGGAAARAVARDDRLGAVGGRGVAVRVGGDGQDARVWRGRVDREAEVARLDLARRRGSARE